MHAMNGNSLGAKQFLAACSCLLAIPVIRETDQVIGVASEEVQDIILEGGNQIRETMTTVSMTCQVVKNVNPSTPLVYPNRRFHKITTPDANLL